MNWYRVKNFNKVELEINVIKIGLIDLYIFVNGMISQIFLSNWTWKNSQNEKTR